MEKGKKNTHPGQFSTGGGGGGGGGGGVSVLNRVVPIP